MSSIKIIFQKLPASELDFQHKLKSISASAPVPEQAAIQEIQSLKIKNAVIGPNHFAFLTDDGRICRVRFSLHPSLLNKERSRDKDTLTTGGPAAPPPYSAGSGYDVFFQRRAARGHPPPPRHRSSLIAGRIRPGGSRAQVDESLQVPEDRIAQCQAILAGKSRDIIKRELQRTNLDVNMAINNILSRDDGEEPPPLGAGGIGSLIQSFHNSEEIFNLIDQDPRTGTASGDVLDSILGRTGRSRIMGRGSQRRREDKEQPPEKRFRSGKKEKMVAEDEDGAIHYDLVEWWPGEEQFTALVSLHSELVALDTKGRLHQWCWAETLAYACPHKPGHVFHPRTEPLGLLNEEVTILSGSVCRASFITKSHKIGTLCDAALAGYARFFEHKAQSYPDFNQGQIGGTAQLATCSQWSLLHAKNELYWWGVVPYEQRAKQLDKMKKAATKGTEELVVGSQVVMRRQPVYRAGTKAVKLLDNEPKVGELTQDVHKADQDAKIEFRIIEPDGVDTTNTTTESALMPQERRKRTFSESRRGVVTTEKWKMNRVIFFPEETDELSGRIVRIDGDICCVSFGDGDELKVTDEKIRLVRRDELCLAQKPASGNIGMAASLF